MKILLTSHGSTGDIYPIIALGKALLKNGHIVRFSCAPLFKDEIEQAGITFLHLPPDWKQEVFTECMRELDRQPNVLRLLRQIYRSGLPFMGELIDRMDRYIAGHDLVIGSYVFPHIGVLAEKHQVPFAVVVFSHNVVPSKSNAPEFVPKLRAFPKWIRERWNRLAWCMVSGIIDMTVNRVIHPVLREKNLPKMKHFLLKPADLCIVAVSRELMKGVCVSERFKTVGYLRNQTAYDPEIEKELDAFCQGEKVSILNFGSVSFDHIEGVMSRFEKYWEKGKKIILQSGWAGLSLKSFGNEFKTIGKMSHNQLFRRASVVIHHGGAGTTAAVFHAGKPQIVVPHFGDQYFWASEVCRRSCGLSVPQKNWPELLPEAVSKIQKQKKYLQNAESFAAILAKENGPACAAKIIEDYVAHR
tara:strand:+ start:1131 stop:2375 length:1245 start_codon:yes stop_codon:yes gene_type:complete